MKKGDTLLVVEDDEAISFLISTNLEDLGFKCHTVYTVNQAKKVLNNFSETIQLVLCDYNLPDGTALKIRWLL